MNPNRLKFIVYSIMLAFVILVPAILMLIDTDILAVFALLPMWAIGQGILYKRFYLGVKPRYPMGATDPDDIYFPRSNIPRPIYLDERKRKAAMRNKREN